MAGPWAGHKTLIHTSFTLTIISPFDSLISFPWLNG
jgi:hypothetical protein